MGGGGLSRVRCSARRLCPSSRPDCHHEMFAAFSCKHRCTCPFRPWEFPLRNSSVRIESNQLRDSHFYFLWLCSNITLSPNRAPSFSNRGGPIHHDRTSIGLLQRMQDPENHEAWQEFLKRYHRIISAWARQFLRDANLGDVDADDVTAMVYVRISEILPTFEYDQSKSFRSYIKTMVSRKCINLLKQHARDHDLLHDYVAMCDRKCSQLADTINGQIIKDHTKLKACLDAVKARVAEQTWNAFWLVEVEDRTPKEAALALDISESQVHVNRFRVSKHLQEEWRYRDTGDDGS